jgi:hypothetical protein
MSIYSNSEELFSDLIKYNELNMEYLGKLQFPMTNLYYITFFNPNDNKSLKFMSYLNNFENQNPFINVKPNINIDEEQICIIELSKCSLNQIDKMFNEIFENVKKSNSKISIVLDIGFIFNIISSFENDETEIHLYDFLLHKLKKQVDKLFILDTENILKINGTYSSVYDELKMYLLIQKEPYTTVIPNIDVTIYKYHDSLYWRILDLNQHIEKIDSEDQEDQEENDENETFNELSIYEIDNKEAFIKNIKLSKIAFTNLFDMHSIVLHPLNKLKILLKTQ